MVDAVSIVSFDDYRSEGVTVFSGRGRGRVVAEAVRDEYGDDVEVKVPDDVILIDRSFRAAFSKVLPDVEIPSALSS